MLYLQDMIMTPGIKSVSLLIIALFMSCLFGCSMFFEEDIEDDIIVIVAPANDLKTEILTHTFWWELIDGTEDYRLQIVSPSFSGAEMIILDSLVTGDKFEVTFQPGIYEWRIRGENSAYHTEWSYATLTVFESDDLTRQKNQLKNPLENSFSKMEQLEFLWDIMPNAETYEFRLYKDNWDESLILDSVGISDNSVILELDENEFWWGVRAMNSISATSFSSRRIVVDRTPPGKPVPESPANNATLSDSTVVFKWNSNDPLWNIVMDSLFIYEERSNQTSLLFHKELYSEKTATVKLFRGKEYSWYVKSIDKAGNEGGESDKIKFSINN